MKFVKLIAVIAAFAALLCAFDAIYRFISCNTKKYVKDICYNNPN